MTPARVSMSGVSFVFATPRIERRRISRAASVYSCLTRSSWLTRGSARGLVSRGAWAESPQLAAEEHDADRSATPNPATQSSQ